MKKALLLLLSASFIYLAACENNSDQIRLSTEIIELTNKPTIYVSRYSYGLNGQHSKMVISDRQLDNSGMTTSAYPIFLSGSPVYILDTFPKPIIYYTVEPQNIKVEAAQNFDWYKLTGSEKYYLDRTKSKELLKLSF